MTEPYDPYHAGNHYSGASPAPDPNILRSELAIGGTASRWQPRPVSNEGWNATGSDPSGYARSIIRDGQVVGYETGKKTTGGSTAIASSEANAAVATPYDYAMDGKTKCRISPHELKDDSIVSFNGTEITVAQARSIGWLSPQPNLLQQVRADGEREVALNTPHTDNKPPEATEHPDLVGEALTDAAVEQEFAALVEKTGGYEQLDAIKQVVSTGEVDAHTLGALADQLQIEPGQLQEKIAPIMLAFESQARAVMSEGGLDSNAVVAWAQSHRPDKLNLAMRKQATMRQTSGYADLRQDYLESLAEHDPDTALRANLGQGNSSYKDEKGRVIVRLSSGATMEWRQAIRAFGPRKS